MFKTAVNKELHELLKKIKQHRVSHIFCESIEKIIAMYPYYKDVISKPIDLVIIEKKIINKEYPSAEDFKNDIYLMLNNCRTFNSTIENYIKIADTLQSFFDNNFKKTEAKIAKNIEKLEQQQNAKVSSQSGIVGNSNINMLHPKFNFSNNNRVPLILGSSEEEKIYEKIYSTFTKIANELNIEESKVEDQVTAITKSLVKRNKSFETIVEETTSFLNNSIKNKDDKEGKLKFLKKFKKLVKSIKDEQGDEQGKLNIKVNLNKDKNVDEIKNSKEIIDNAVKFCQEFIENQSIPKSYYNSEEFPIE